jgi:hypothetical protein
VSPLVVMLGAMMTIAAVPAGLHVPTHAAPMTADAIDLLAELIVAGTDGVHLDADRQRLARELHGRHLARPTARPGVMAVALAWHVTEARRMHDAAPAALNEWTPPWWPTDTLNALAAVIAPELGDDLALWFAASVAGLELADGRRALASGPARSPSV